MNITGKKILSIALACIIVVSIGTVKYLWLNAKSTATIIPSTANDEPAAPSYIGNSSIYLLSANSSYGTYDGTSVFMVNVTVRNDYTLQQQPPNNSSASGTGEAYFILLANLYDKNNTQINAQEYIPPQDHPDYSQVSVNSGGTTSLTIYMATSNRDVEHYSLAFGYLGAVPIA